MIEGLKPYPAMRESGVPWLGAVPAHWEYRRIKTLLREKEDRSGDGSGVLLSLTRSRGIIPHAEASKRIASAEDFSKYKAVRSGDLVMNRMQAWSGMFALSIYEGIISPDYSVFRAIGEIDLKYFEHLFKTPMLIDQFAQRSKGIGSGFNRLYTPDFGNVPIVIPSLQEQSVIVRFLDHADQRIRRYIHAKRKLIALLQEQKQAIIHRAVTRGLDLNVRLKPSGVEWLGDVPEHWEIRRNARLFRERIEPGRSDLPVLMVSLRTGVTVASAIDEDGRPRRLIADREAYKYARKGDIAYNMMRMWQGALGTAPVDGVVSPAYVVAIPQQGVLSEYFAHLFGTDYYKNEVNRCSRGIVSDRNRLYWDDFKALISLVPPFEEQNSIVQYINDATQSIDAALSTISHQANLLREFRTRLVADVVTGKLDVREAAARLPDIADEADALVEDEAMDEGEEALEDGSEAELEEVAV